LGAETLYSALTADVLSFASPKESSQRKGDPWVGAGLRPVPCATRRAGRLAKLACGSDNASRLPPPRLRCSAPLKGVQKKTRRDCSAPPTACCGRPRKTANFARRPQHHHRFTGPLGRCRATQALADQGRGLSEPRSGEFRSPRQRRVAQGTRQSRAPTQGRLFFAYFLLATQKKVMPRVRRGIKR
jgi:hypothetical protein